MGLKTSKYMYMYMYQARCVNTFYNGGIIVVLYTHVRRSDFTKHMYHRYEMFSDVYQVVVVCMSCGTCVLHVVHVCVHMF